MKSNIKNLLFSLFLLLISFSCNKKDISNNKKETTKDNITSTDLNFLKAEVSKFNTSIKIDFGSLKKIDLNVSSYIIIGNLNADLEKLMEGTSNPLVVLINTNGNSTVHIDNFVSTKAVNFLEIDTAVANVYSKVKNLPILKSKTTISGYLSHYSSNGGYINSEYIKNGLYFSPLYIQKKILKVTAAPEVPSSNLRVNSCKDYYLVTRWYDSYGTLVRTDAVPLFSLCDSGGGGAPSETVTNISSNTDIILCDKTFKFNPTATNWQAAYVTNYNFTYVGSDGSRDGTQVEYDVTMNFEIGLPNTLQNGTQITDAFSKAANAWNVAEHDVAEKCAGNGYAGLSTLKAEQQIKKDLLSFTKSYLDLMIGASASTVTQGYNTADPAKAVQAVYWGPDGCPH